MLRIRHRQDARGFTLLELMVVTMIVGAVILLVPVAMMGFGARSRLELSANSVVASLAGTRSQAVQDGYEAYLELGWVEINEEDRAAIRVRFTNLPVEKKLGPDRGGMDETLIDRSAEREWVYTPWKALPKGIVWNGVSVARGQWKKLNPGGKPYSIKFYASGDVERAFAIRIESEDLEEVDDEYRIATIMVNGLTSEPSWMEGLGELREALDGSHFNY